MQEIGAVEEVPAEIGQNNGVGDRPGCGDEDLSFEVDPS